ncbi:MAG: hypothetical protein HYZ29_17145 [Myxococcales bacterium]|nr:hypothetical protein [Myxococcales bacterium]
MTRKKDDETLVEELLPQAFAQKGEVIPTSEAEVRRAEDEGVEFEGELPDSLKALRAPEQEQAPRAQAPEVVSLAAERRRRNPWLTHALAAGIGAAAAAALLWGRRDRPEPGGQLPTSEPAPVRTDAAPPPEVLTLPAVVACGKSCCAGARCGAAKSELSTCSSGRTCIACSNEELGVSRYRLRLSSFAPTEAGAKAVAAAGPGGLELCVRVGSSERACVAAHASTDEAEQWTVLPLVASAQDFVAGFVLEVRPKAASNLLVGEWRSPVQINPTLLCKGLSLRPKNGKGDELGVVSAFLDDAHFVELRRDASAQALVDHRRRFVVADVPAKLFESRSSGDRRFVLALGPVDKPTAERLRWTVLERGEDAKLSVGEDFTGEPKALP